MVCIYMVVKWFGKFKFEGPSGKGGVVDNSKRSKVNKEFLLDNKAEFQQYTVSTDEFQTMIACLTTKMLH